MTSDGPALALSSEKSWVHTDEWLVHRLDAADSNAAKRSASEKFNLPLQGCTLQEATDVISFFYSKDAGAGLTPRAIPVVLKVLDMFSMTGGVTRPQS